MDIFDALFHNNCCQMHEKKCVIAKKLSYIFIDTDTQPSTENSDDYISYFFCEHQQTYFYNF